MKIKRIITLAAMAVLPIAAAEQRLARLEQTR